MAVVNLETLVDEDHLLFNLFMVNGLYMNMTS